MQTKPCGCLVDPTPTQQSLPPLGVELWSYARLLPRSDDACPTVYRSTAKSSLVNARRSTLPRPLPQRAVEELTVLTLTKYSRSDHRHIRTIEHTEGQVRGVLFKTLRRGFLFNCPYRICSWCTAGFHWHRRIRGKHLPYWPRVSRLGNSQFLMSLIASGCWEWGSQNWWRSQVKSFIEPDISRWSSFDAELVVG